MRHKRLIEIFFAAAVMAASVPILPAYAAEGGGAEPAEQTAESNPARDESGTTDDGYDWTHFAAADAEKSEMQQGKNGTFTAEWKNTAYSIFSSGKTFDETLPWDSYFNLRCDYETKVEWTGNGVAGLTVSMQDGNTVVDGCIIDAWSCEAALSEQLSGAEMLNACKINGIDYDIYTEYISQISITGTPTLIRRYLSVRHENGPANTGGGIVNNSANVTAHIQEWSKYGKEIGDLIGIYAYVEVTAYQTACINEGSAAVLVNKILTDGDIVSDNKTESGVTTDGYIWSHESTDPTGLSEMQIGKEGTFTAKWENTSQSCFSIGKRFSETPAWDEIAVTCKYETTVNSAGSYWAGVRVFMKDGLTIIEGTVLDAWNSKVYADKIGEVTINGTEYEIYTQYVAQESIAGTAPQIRRYWSVRKQYDLPENGGTFRNEVNLTQHMKVWEEYGKEMGSVISVNTFVEGFDVANQPPVSSGTAAVTKNQITYNQKLTPRKAELAAGQTRITLYDKNTGKLIPSEQLKHHHWSVGTDIITINPNDPERYIETKSTIEVTSNPFIIEDTSLFKDAWNIRFVDEYPETTQYENGSMDLVFDTELKVSGDATGDGEFNIADIVMLTKWMMNPEAADMTNWANADFNLDDKLDARDLTLMKRTYFVVRQQPVSVAIEETNLNMHKKNILKVSHDESFYTLYFFPSSDLDQGYYWGPAISLSITEEEYRQIMSVDYEAIINSDSALQGLDETQFKTTLTYSDGTQHTTNANVTEVLILLDQLLEKHNYSR